MQVKVNPLWKLFLPCLLMFAISAHSQSNFRGHCQTNCSPDGVTVAGGNGRGSAPNQLSLPDGLFVDEKNNLWIADTDNGRIQKWAPGATSGVTIGNLGVEYQPGFPTNVYVDKKGNVYVADYFSSIVVKLDVKKNLWELVGGANNEMDLTRGVWVDKHGYVYATDYGNNRVLKYAPGNPSGGVVVAGGNGYGNALNQLARPTSVFVDDDGALYVTDENNDRVVKWKKGATQGIVVAGGNGNGGAANQLNGPVFSMKDQKGNLFVSDRNNERIQKWAKGATKGVTVAGGNGAGSAPNQFNQPFSGTVTKSGFLYVADLYNDRIQRFDLKHDCNPPGPVNAIAVARVDAQQPMEDSESDEVAIFPNPSSNSFNFSGDGASTIIVTDLSGNIVHKTNATTKSFSFGSEFNRGVYLLKVSNARGTNVYRLMKD